MYIVVSIDGNSDNSSDDGDELLSEFFSSDTIPDTSSDGNLTLESEFEDTDDGFEEESVYGNLLNFSFVKFYGLFLISSNPLIFIIFALISLCRKPEFGTREMAQQLVADDALAEDLGSIPQTHMITHNHL